jgi:hypothetical protein
MIRITQFFLIFGFLLLASQAEAALAFRSKTYSTNNSTSITGTEPTGAAQNDIIIAAIIMEKNAFAQATPAGWTQLFLGQGASVDVGLYWIRRGSSAPTYTFTWTTSVWAEISLSAWSGAVQTGSPFEDYQNSGFGLSDPPNPNSPSVTTTSANAFVITVGAQWSGWSTGGGTVPGGYTNVHNTASTDVGVAYKTVASPGAEDPAAWANSIGGSAETHIGFTLVLTPVGAPSLNSGKIKLQEDSTNGSNFTALQAAANLASDLTFTFPSGDGSSGQVLSTNGSGTLSWANNGSTWSLVTKASNYSILTADVYKFFLVSGTSTMTLPSPAAVGAGYRVGFNNSGAGTVTVSRNASENINGANSFNLAAGEACILITDGTNWYYF